MGEQMQNQTLLSLNSWKRNVDTLGIEPRAFRMQSGCDTTTPCALCSSCNQAEHVLRKETAPPATATLLDL